MHSEAFLSEILPAELEEIRKRRETLDMDTDSLDAQMSVDRDIVGLALSGGGIRSATFSLGVIQSLAKHGLLRHVDYLSTVSGGGYIGSCLSALLNDPDNRPEGDRFPLRYTSGNRETPALTHLRNSSNFLSPGGLLNKLRLPNLLLRGVIMMLFVFLPFIMLAVFVTEVAYEFGPHWDNLPKLAILSVGVFLVLAIAFPFLLKLLRRVFDWRWRNRFELLLTVPLLVAGVVLALVPMMHLTRNSIEHSTEQVRAALENLGWQGVWWLAAVIVAILLLFMLAGKASENVSKLRGKLLLGIVGLLGPAILFSIYLLLCLWQIDSPFIPAGSDKVLNQAVACGDTPCLVEDDATDKHRHMQPLGLLKALAASDPTPEEKADLLHVLKGRNIEFYDDAIVTCVSDVPCDAAPRGSWKQDTRTWLIVDNWDDNPAKRALCPPGPDHDLKYRLIELTEEQKWIKQNCTYFERVSERSLGISGAQLFLFTNPRDLWFAGTFLFLLAFNRLFLDINITSPHGFYRDRLSRAFLFKVRGDDTEQIDTLKLSGLNADGTAAPYHLINTALNLQGSNDPGLRGRMSDFFVFAKHHTGSEHTGYVPTIDMEKYDRHLDLATAAAISGAAAAPNMGTTTSRSLIFIMTLLNIRLGYWLPNPRIVSRRWWLKRFRLSGARSTLIWNEALGNLDASHSHVNVSDGGHIENLAIYPLLKRRCRFIVAVDGEADPHMTFGGLVTLMRFARIDLGIDINMDLEGLRKNKRGDSKQGWTYGEIRYGDGEIGHLLYIKLSVCGKEPEYVRAYRAKHAEYPHESTADQFFSEEQFEAYRALGAYIAEDMFAHLSKLEGFRDIRGVTATQP